MRIITNNTHVLNTNWQHRYGRLSVTGTFNGATVKLAYKTGGAWIPMGAPAVLSGPGSCIFEAKSGDQIALIVENGSSPVIDAGIEGWYDE